MAKKIQVTIAEPCHENWENMTPADKGRFCGSCQKQVVDFSNMSDREIAVFFKKPSTGSVCGRFMHDQLDRDMEIPKKRIPWVKYFFQFALPAFLLSIKANSQSVKMGKPAIRTTQPVTPVRTLMGDTNIVSPVQVQPKQTSICISPVNTTTENRIKGEVSVNTNKVPVLTQSVKIPDPSLLTNDVVMIAGGISVVDRSGIETIQGEVINENGDPVPYATIQIDGENNIVQADEDGYFTIEPAVRKWKKVMLHVSSVGFDAKYVEVKRNALDNDDLEVTLVAQKIDLPEVIVTAYPVMGRISRNVMGTVTNATGTTTKAIDIKTIDLMPAKQVLEIYPNPVISGTTINIGCKDMEEGYYAAELLSLSGQLISKRELWIDDKAAVMNMELPKTAAGTYFLRLTNRKSKKSLTEKIIIQ